MVELEVEVTGETATVAINEGNEVTYEPTTGSFEVPKTNTEPIMVELEVQGQPTTVTLEAGNEVTIDAETGTFTTPPDNPTPVVVLVGEEEITVDPGEAAKFVDIDIRPGSDDNLINLGSNGNIPVAIFSTDTFDATTVDPLTVTLADAQVRVKGKGVAQASQEDVNGDGLTDLLVHVDTEGLQLTVGATSTTLEGFTFGGQLIKGSDVVTVVP